MGLVSAEKEWSNPLLPKGKRTQKTDDARETAESADDFLKELDALLDKDRPEK